MFDHIFHLDIKTFPCLLLETYSYHGTVWYSTFTFTFVYIYTQGAFLLNHPKTFWQKVYFMTGSSFELSLRRGCGGQKKQQSQIFHLDIKTFLCLLLETYSYRGSVWYSTRAIYRILNALHSLKPFVSWPPKMAKIRVLFKLLKLLDCLILVFNVFRVSHPFLEQAKYKQEQKHWYKRYCPIIIISKDKTKKSIFFISMQIWQAGWECPLQ